MEIKNVANDQGLIAGMIPIQFSQVWKYYAVRNDGDEPIWVLSGYAPDVAERDISLMLEPGATGIVELDFDIATIFTDGSNTDVKCTIVGQSDKVLPWISRGGGDSGGAGRYTETVLYTYTLGGSYTNSITIASGYTWSDFDQILFIAGDFTDTSNPTQDVFVYAPSSEMNLENNGRVLCVRAGGSYIYYELDSTNPDTTLSYLSKSGNVGVYQIIGIRFNEVAI